MLEDVMKPLPALAIFLAFCNPALAQPKASPATNKFVSEVARSDMFEIQSSELAAQKADDATKSFARQNRSPRDLVDQDRSGIFGRRDGA